MTAKGIVTEPVALLPTDPLIVAPGPGLRLVRRRALWPEWKGRAFAAGLLLLSWRLVFPDMRGFIPLAIGLVGWLLPLSWLVIGRDRITGMRHVRREIWIRPATSEAPRTTEVPRETNAPRGGPYRTARDVPVIAQEEASGGHSIWVDGRVVGSARGVTVWLYKIATHLQDNRGSSHIEYFSLSLLIGTTIYEVARTRWDREAMRRAGAQLAHALGAGDSAREKDCGWNAWTSQTAGELAAMWSLCVPPEVAAFCMDDHHHLSAYDPWRVLVGVLAIAARASVGFGRLSIVMQGLEVGWRVLGTGQLDAKAFAKTFPGAKPACPVPWLTRKVGLRIFLCAHAMLYAVGIAVASCRP